MGIPRHKARRDKNEPGIVDCFRRHGFTVQTLSANNVPDLLSFV